MPNLRTPKPKWLRRGIPTGPEFAKVRALLRESGLHTVCEEAKCPNMGECFSNNTSTFLIMGPNCTRNCKYCSVVPGKVRALDPEEPATVARAAKILGLKYVVVTSVTRDDVPDGGAAHFAATIAALRKEIPDCEVEVLIPDFAGDADALAVVVREKPDVLNHNLETVKRLFETARPQASYDMSLALLRNIKKFDPDMPTKSGIMLGLGETDEELEQALRDLRDAGCTMLTLGQYLQPTKESLQVERFVTPEAFDAWRDKALAMGFTQVASGPLVRSSYHAKELFKG